MICSTAKETAEQKQTQLVVLPPDTIEMVWIKRVDINIVYHGPIRCCDPSLDQKDRILKSNIIIDYNVTGFGDILDIDYYDWFDKSFLS